MTAAKQTFKAPTYVRVGDKEVVKSRTFTRIATNLSLASTGYSDEVPAFNPLKLLAGDATQAEALPEVVQAPDEADVSFSTFDLNDISLLPSQALLSSDEIQAQVSAYMKSASPGLRSPLPIPPQLLLMRTSRAGLDLNGASPLGGADTTLMSAPFSNIQVRMVPENVSLIAKADPPGAEKIATEKLVIVRRNERLEDILRTHNVKPDAIASIMAAFGPLKRGELPVSEGQKLKMLFLDWDERIGQVLARLSIYNNDNLEMIIAMNDDLKYQQVARVEFQAKTETKPGSDEEEEEDTDSIRLYDSFYETALKQEVPKPIINDLVRIFANDVDFQRAATPSDSFEVFYEESEEGDGRTELLYASITVRNETFKYYRYQAPEDTTIDFFDENGKSTRKFLIRKPIAQGEQRSGFGRRFHPILGYSRMHTGVDWSAPTGTPIVAAGNGTVIKAKRESGYGNRVEIQHPNGYITTYNHMSGLQFR
ncbi:MAG: M23 family metallopeptidase [Alphaproteobacteria bacterium]|nr:M23 family metallopeptidase [Alphaproteobacteria bacterium]